MDFSWSWRRLIRKQTTCRPDNVWPDMWKHLSDASKRKEKHKWAIEKPRLENARGLRHIFFIDPDGEEFKRKVQKMLVGSWKFRYQQQCLEGIQHNKHRETCCTVRQHKTKYARIVEADESFRIRMERSQNKNHEVHIVGRGMNSLNHKKLVHILIPMPQAKKIPDAKAAVEKNGKIGRNPGMASWQKVRKKKEVIDEARNEGQKSSFCVIDGSLSS